MAKKIIKEAKRSPGKPRIEFGDNVATQVKQMAGFGLTQEQIALIIGVSETTLKNKFKTELSAGTPSVVYACASNLMIRANGIRKPPKQIVDENGNISKVLGDWIYPPDPVSNMFILKCRGRWQETANKKIEDSDEDGEALKLNENISAKESAIHYHSVMNGGKKIEITKYKNKVKK